MYGKLENATVEKLADKVSELGVCIAASPEFADFCDDFDKAEFEKARKIISDLRDRVNRRVKEIDG